MFSVQDYLDQTDRQDLKIETLAFLANLELVAKKDPQIAQSILQELQDQRTHLKLIASENYSSLSVQAAMGNLLTDKYAEGCPFHRFYAGCENIDEIESRACQELKEIFGCEHAYVQAHSGADANLLAFWAILLQRVQNPEVERLGKKRLDELSDEEYESVRTLMNQQKLMGLSLNSGGHLTHGYRHNISSKMMRSVSYDVHPDSHLLDYEDIEKQVLQEKPDILLAGYSSYTRKVNFAKLRAIADKVGATFMVDMAHFAGLVAGKVFQGDFDPVPHAHIVTSTTHKTLRGPRGGIVLCTKEFAPLIDKGCPLVLGGPLPHVMAAKALAFKEANTKEFQDYAQDVVSNAQSLAKELQNLGANIITGGTDNHIVLLDVRSFDLNGKQAEFALRQCKITVNRNTIPFDPQGAWYTSGVRFGTAALTSLGMKAKEMKHIAQLIYKALCKAQVKISEKTGKANRAQALCPEDIQKEIQNSVHDLLEKFPLYPEIQLSHLKERQEKIPCNIG